MTTQTHSQILIKSHIENLLQFLEPHLKFANCHMVDFFTNSAFNNYLPEVIQKEVADCGLKNTINQIFKNDLNHLPHTKQYVESSETFTLKNCKNICLSADSFIEKLKLWGCDNVDGLKLEIFMSSKKSHEVEILSAVAASLSKVCNVSHIVDIGDGKGYLSSLIALQYKIPVLGIDASDINTCGAVKRATKLSRVWGGIQREPKKSYPAKDDKTASTDISLYKQVTQFIASNFDLEKLVSDIYQHSPPLRLGLTGLHTCGNLAPNSLKIFCENDCIKSICNVGCCYHLLSEKFENSDCNNSRESDFVCGFPLSKFLTDKQIIIGRSARMIANHSVERILESSDLPNKTIYYRALLQVLFEKHCEKLPTKHVGKFRKECKNFLDYARKAMQRVDVNIVVSDEEIEKLDMLYESKIDELNVFYLLRSKLSPVIESLILLDRLLFLYEQGYNNSYIVQFFNPLISPRCYGIVVLKDVVSQEK